METKGDPGAYCPTAGAIVPMHDETCDWCGKMHEPEYEWDQHTACWVPKRRGE